MRLWKVDLGILRYETTVRIPDSITEKPKQKGKPK